MNSNSALEISHYSDAEYVKPIGPSQTYSLDIINIKNPYYPITSKSETLFTATKKDECYYIENNTEMRSFLALERIQDKVVEHQTLILIGSTIFKTSIANGKGLIEFIYSYITDIGFTLPKTIQNIELDKEIIIGRVPDSSIYKYAIDDKFISQSQCKIIFKEHGIIITDLNSMNRTWISFKKVKFVCPSICIRFESLLFFHLKMINPAVTSEYFQIIHDNHITTKKPTERVEVKITEKVETSPLDELLKKGLSNYEARFLLKYFSENMSQILDIIHNKENFTNDIAKNLIAYEYYPYEAIAACYVNKPDSTIIDYIKWINIVRKQLN